MYVSKLSVDSIFTDLQMKTCEILSRQRKSILCGYFNVTLHNPLRLTSIDEFVNSLSGQGYFRFILKPTRLSPENPVAKCSLLYQMWCNYSGGYDCLSGLINYYLSDHVPSYYIYEIPEKKFKILFGNRGPCIWIVAATNLFCAASLIPVREICPLQTPFEAMSWFLETMYKAYYCLFPIR